MNSPEEQREARISALCDVLRWHRLPISAAIERLREFPWDSDELVVMTRADSIACLDLYLSGSISAADVELWANALEGRDDLAFDDQRLNELLYELANPDLTAPLTTDLARRWRNRLDD